MKGNIYITQQKNYSTGYNIYSFSEFFKVGDDLILSIKDDCLTFTKPSLSYGGKTNRVGVSRLTDGKCIKIVTLFDLPLKEKLEFDEEESNEDRVVIYFNKKQEDN